jgi:hypothetical protein
MAAIVGRNALNCFETQRPPGRFFFGSFGLATAAELEPAPLSFEG